MSQDRFFCAAVLMTGITAGLLGFTVLHLVTWPIPVEILIGAAIGWYVGGWGGKQFMRRLPDSEQTPAEN